MRPLFEVAKLVATARPGMKESSGATPARTCPVRFGHGWPRLRPWAGSPASSAGCRVASTEPRRCAIPRPRRAGRIRGCRRESWRKSMRSPAAGWARCQRRRAGMSCAPCRSPIAGPAPYSSCTEVRTGGRHRRRASPAVRSDGTARPCPAGAGGRDRAARLDRVEARNREAVLYLLQAGATSGACRAGDCMRFGSVSGFVVGLVAEDAVAKEPESGPSEHLPLK